MNDDHFEEPEIPEPETIMFESQLAVLRHTMGLPHNVVDFIKGLETLAKSAKLEFAGNTISLGSEPLARKRLKDYLAKQEVSNFKAEFKSKLKDKAQILPALKKSMKNADIRLFINQEGRSHFIQISGNDLYEKIENFMAWMEPMLSSNRQLG